MEPATIISGVVAYLGARLAENKSIKEFFNDLSSAAVKWIRPIFFKDDETESDTLKQFKENPKSDARQKHMEATIQIAAESEPNATDYLKELMRVIEEKDQEGSKIIANVIGSKATVIAKDIKVQGDFNVGNKNLADE